MLSRQNDARALPVADEAAEHSSEARGLSLLTHRALSLLTRQAPLPADNALAAQRVLEDLPLELAVGRYDMFAPEVRRALPARVVESWRFYAGVVEARGWGVVHVLDLALSAEHDDVLVVHAVTHAGEGYLEVYDNSGEPLASGRSDDGRLSSWDERFGEVRGEARALVIS